MALDREQILGLVYLFTHSVTYVTLDTSMFIPDMIKKQ